MRDNYEACLARSLAWEGGYSNHPKDPGGATMRGVTQRVYDGWRRHNGKSPQSVRDIANAELQAIYRELYADKIVFDRLPAGVDCAVFDGAINSGPAQAAKWLQRALGVVVDGNIGPATIDAAQAHPNKRALVRQITANRRAFLRALRTYPTFGKGWMRRCDSIEAFALTLVSGRQSTPQTDEPTVRATISDAAPRPSKRLGDTATGAGVATASVTAAINSSRETLQPLAGQGGWIDTTLAVLAVASVLLVAGGLLYRWYQKQAAQDQARALDLPAQVAT